MEANQVLNFGPQSPTRGIGRYWYGDYDLGRLQLTQCVDRDPHAGARGDAVINKDYYLPLDFEPRPTATIGSLAASQFLSFRCRNQFNFQFGDSNCFHNFIVKKTNSSARNRSES